MIARFDANQNFQPVKSIFHLHEYFTYLLFNFAIKIQEIVVQFTTPDILVFIHPSKCAYTRTLSIELRGHFDFTYP